MSCQLQRCATTNRRLPAIRAVPEVLVTVRSDLSRRRCCPSRGVPGSWPAAVPASPAARPVRIGGWFRSGLVRPRLLLGRRRRHPARAGGDGTTAAHEFGHRLGRDRARPARPAVRCRRRSSPIRQRSSAREDGWVLGTAPWRTCPRVGRSCEPRTAARPGRGIPAPKTSVGRGLGGYDGASTLRFADSAQRVGGRPIPLCHPRRRRDVAADIPSAPRTRRSSPGCRRAAVTPTSASTAASRRGLALPEDHRRLRRRPRVEHLVRRHPAS